MANAIILHRRRVEKIEPGNQSFMSNGTFLAPYTATYNVKLYGSTHKAGTGGSGGTPNNIFGGGGGGGGGGRSNGDFVVTCQCALAKNELLTITINENIVSFGSYASLATGTAAGNGGSGGSPFSIEGSVLDYEGGNGGVGEGTYTIAAPAGYTISGDNGGSSGHSGSDGDILNPGAGGTGGIYGGGTGGTGDGVNSGRTTGQDGTIGHIDISWGGK